MNADDRFRTTQHTFFGSRPDQLGQDVADQSLSVQSANFRKNKTRIQRGTLNKHETWMQSNARQREDVKKMEDEARLHATSALRLKYLEKVSESATKRVTGKYSSSPLLLYYFMLC